MGRPRIGDMDSRDAIACLFVLAVRWSERHQQVTNLLRRLRDPYWLTEESFGTGPTAEAGQAAMMALVPQSQLPG